MRDTSLDEFVGGDDASTDPHGDDETAGGREDEPAPDHATDTAATSDTTDTTGVVDQDDQQPSAGATGDGRSADSPEAGPAPAVSTFEWTPGGATCSECGEQASGRWRDDGDLVCGSCKTW